MSENTRSEEVVDATSLYVEQLRAKILFGLSIYKFVNPSMLHVFLGTSTPSAIWKEQVLAQLIEEGLVISETISLTSAADRAQTYTVLHLPENVFVTPAEPCAPEATTDAQAA